ncbi:MAG: hypothetical protein ACYTE6_00150 [Planctomycetota bacterium]|jgi:hypothetical protein
MARSHVWRPLLAGLLLAAPGLAAQPAETPPAAIPSSATPPAEVKPAAQKGPTVVTLIEPGAGPHRPLRYRPKVGVPEVIEMTVQADTEESLGGVALPKRKIPAMQHTMQVIVTDVGDKGEVSYDFEYLTADVIDEPGVNPLVRESFRSMLKLIEGLRGNGTITDEGYNTSLTVEGTAGMDPVVRQQIGEIERSMEQLVSPLPSEPVGIGAIWQVENTFEQQGMLVRQTSVVKLLADDGDRLKLKADVCQDAKPQKFKAPGMGPMSLKAYEAEGAVTTVLRLSRRLPDSLVRNMTIDITLLFGSPGAEQELHQHTELRSETKKK